MLISNSFRENKVIPSLLYPPIFFSILFISYTILDLQEITITSNN